MAFHQGERPTPRISRARRTYALRLVESRKVNLNKILAGIVGCLRFLAGTDHVLNGPPNSIGRNLFVVYWQMLLKLRPGIFLLFYIHILQQNP